MTKPQKIEGGKELQTNKNMTDNEKNKLGRKIINKCFYTSKGVHLKPSPSKIMRRLMEYFRLEVREQPKSNYIKQVTFKEWDKFKKQEPTTSYPAKSETGLFTGNITREQAIIIGLGRNEDGLVDYEVEGVCLGEWLQRVITKMVASERQRCVEALPSEIGVRRGRDNLYDTPMGMMDMTDGEVEAFNQAIYQAKHNLEQLK